MGLGKGSLLVLLCCCLVAAEGSKNVQHLDLEWKDVSCGVGKKDILRNVSGKAGAGRLLAVMGPSGSGKTTLLNALAGQIPYSKKTRLYGELTVGGAEREEGQDQAYVKQQDVFYSQLTVRETLLMAARLRLPRSMPLEKKTQMVDDLIHKLGLSKVVDTIVGDDKTQGISGGEKKRLSIACQLFGTPSLIFCDEPTSGLDSFQAERVMSTLRELAKDGHTVVCSIHQPRSSIFRMFDDLLVLSEGRVMFLGPANRVAGHFRSLGHTMPSNTNPAEFAIDVVSVDYTSKESEEASRERIDNLASSMAPSSLITLNEQKSTAWNSPILAGMFSRGGTTASQKPIESGLSERGRRRHGGGNGRDKNVQRGGAQRAGPFEQFRLLLARSWRQVNRAKFANITRVAANLGSAVIFGSIFWKLGLGQSHINDRIGLLQTAAIQCAMSTVVKTLNTFPTESTIVKAERSLSMYGILPYFLSKIIAELPISALFPNIFGAILYQMTGLHPRRDRMAKFLGVLTIEAFAASALGMAVGALAKDEEAALALGPAVMTVFILFSGFYISQDNIPRALRWIKDVSIIKHAFEGFCVNELEGLEFQCDTKSRGPCIKTGEQMLARVAFDESTVAGATMGLSRVLAGCWLSTYLALTLSNPKFQTMKDPSLAADVPSSRGRPPMTEDGVEGGRRGIFGFFRRRRQARLKSDGETKGVSGGKPSDVGIWARRTRQATPTTAGGNNVVGGRQTVSVLRAGL